MHLMLILLYRPRPSLVAILLLLQGFACSSADDTQLGNTRFVFERTKDLILLGAAVPIRLESMIMLNNLTQFSIGRALHSKPVRMKAQNDRRAVSSFSTSFLFCIVPAPTGPHGDGMAFIMTSSKFLLDALPGGYLGLTNSTASLFAVEFDTHLDKHFNDPDANHVGVDINKVYSIEAQAAGFWDLSGAFQKVDLSSGRNIQAWIDYDHPKYKLNITVIYSGYPRPPNPLISMDIDLSFVMEEEMYVGFSAATGEYAEQHYVLAWSFTTNGRAPSLTTDVPRAGNISDAERAPPKGAAAPDSKRQSSSDQSAIARFWLLGFIAGVLLVCALLAGGIWTWLRRRRYKEESLQKWELEYWPHRFTFKELSLATNGFDEQHLLGHGGFGRVYHGVLPGSGLELAVKCITREFKEGMKGFVAEITSLGRLQHRNLVQLRGWCRRHKQLFIVYDYMPNGSLDKLIFGNPEGVLLWSQRYHILKGVAAGLLYLHEQGQKRVVHRDIKSCNVLLDAELNGRLGDFGLAKLYDHSENPQTTHVVGTPGYIAPELIQTGKATPSSDVYSFGALLLEVACGRRPVDPSKGSEKVVVVEWVWDLGTKDRLLDAADPKLCCEYDTEEMLTVLKLGLLCSHPEAEFRPGIRLVSQILQGEASMPDMDMATFNIRVKTPRGLLSPNSRNLISFSSSEISSEEEARNRTRNASASDHSYSRASSFPSLARF